jgi:hypothetical protein
MYTADTTAAVRVRRGAARRSPTACAQRGPPVSCACEAGAACRGTWARVTIDQLRALCSAGAEATHLSHSPGAPRRVGHGRRRPPPAPSHLATKNPINTTYMYSCNHIENLENLDGGTFREIRGQGGGTLRRPPDMSFSRIKF